jgi:hypothetical protein
MLANYFKAALKKTAKVPNGITINTIGRSVVINGYDGVVAIYNMSGAIVYQGYANNNIELPTTGVYIVKIANTSHKRAIK